MEHWQTAMMIVYIIITRIQKILSIGINTEIMERFF